MDLSVGRRALALGVVLSACGGGGQGGEAPPRSAGQGVDPSASGAPAPAPEPPAILEEPLPDSVGSVTLEPLVVGIRPGSTFLLAARFRIAPGYRIGWKVAGEVGEATRVTFRAPPGFEVGPVLFPAPERYTAPGGFVGYGYEKETAVFAQVNAPPRLGRQDVHRFDLEASFVACKKQCGSERTAAFVELTTAHGDVKATEVEAALTPFRARLPRPASELGAGGAWELGGRHAAFVVTLASAKPTDFFSDGTASPAPVKTVLGDREARFVFDEAPRPGSRPLRGVLVVESEGLITAVDVEAPLPGEEDGAGAGAGDGRAGAGRPRGD